MNTQKGFASILVVLLGIIVIGGGVYIYDQKNDLGIFDKKESTESISIDENKENKNNNFQINQEKATTTGVEASVEATSSVKILPEIVKPNQTIKTDVATTSNSGTSLEIKDCKENMDCFTKAIPTCEPAKATYTTETGIEGMFIQTTITYSELRPKISSCQVYSKMIETKTKYLIPVDQETLDTAEKMSQFQKGRDGLCTIVDKKLYAKILNDLSKGDISFSTAGEGELANFDGKVYANNCTGSLYTIGVIEN